VNINKVRALSALILLLAAACQAATTPAPTQTPLPTYTPYPTYTPLLATNTSAPSATSVPPTSTLVPTEVPVPTEAAVPTATPLPPKGQAFSYQGVSLIRPDGIGSGLVGKLAPAVKGDDNTPDFVTHPPYIEISVQGYPTQNKYHKPRLEIYKVADLMAGSDFLKGIVANLQAIVAQKPPLVSAASQLPTQTLPFLPVFNAAQIIHTKGQYVTFKNGTGIRYLTQFDQAFLPINNQEVIYTFQGLTSDGKYYVVAVLPVAAPVLAPTDDYKATGKAFVPFPADTSDPQVVQRYFQDVLAKVDALADSEFMPSLTLLDAMLQSVQVQ
jgi:hypothetical protein